MAQACAVLEQERVRCDPSSPSDAPQKQPYRAPTYPASGILASLTPFAGPGSGSGTEWRLTGSGGQRGPPPSTQVSAGRPPAQLQNAGARRGLPEAGADNGSSASLSFSSQWDQGDMTGQRDVEGQGEASGRAGPAHWGRRRWCLLVCVCTCCLLIFGVLCAECVPLCAVFLHQSTRCKHRGGAWLRNQPAPPPAHLTNPMP